MTRRARPAPRSARRPRPDGPAQTGLWGDDTAVTVPAVPEIPPTNDPEQWARVLTTAAADPGYVVAARGSTRGGRRVMARVPGSPDTVTPVPSGEAAVVLAALDAGHVSLGAGTRTVRHGRQERPAARVLVPARTRSLLARWAALRPLTTDRTDRKD